MKTFDDLMRAVLTILPSAQLEEDNYGQADLPLAIIPSTGEVVLLQLDGHLTPDQFEEAMDLATSGCMDLYKIMRDALDKSYGGKK